MFGFGKKKTPDTMGHENRTYYDVGAPTKVEENKYTGKMEIPTVKDMLEAQEGFQNDKDNPQPDKIIDQHYSPLGIPLTSDGWDVQNAIDGGKLHKLYTSTMLQSMDGEARSTLLGEISPEHRAIVESGDFSKMKAEDFETFSAALQGAGATRDFFKDMDSKEYTAFQEGILDNYIAQANAGGENASFILDLMPTDTDMMQAGEVLNPNEFRAGEDVHKIRVGSSLISQQLQENNGPDHEVYGLAIPYANIKENIIRNFGVPKDGAEHLDNYLSHIDGSVNTVATGYSQGGAALTDYLDDYANAGNANNLDYAVATAPMGGTDRKGGDGVWAGEWNGVETLSIENANDPAKLIHNNYESDYWDTWFGQVPIPGSGTKKFVDAALNFTKQDGSEDKVGLGELHAGYDHDNPGAGTYGYPMQVEDGKGVSDWMGDLFNGNFEDQDYSRRADWNEDARPDKSIQPRS